MDRVMAAGLRQIFIMACVDRELFRVLFGDVLSREDDMSMVVKDIEMLSVEMDQDFLVSEGGRDSIGSSANGQDGIRANLPGFLFACLVTRFWQTNEKGTFFLPRLIRDSPSSTVDSLVGDVVEPKTEFSVEVFHGFERAVTQEISFHKPEDALVFALAIGVSHLAEKGFEAVIFGEFEESRVPEGLMLGADRAQNDSGHSIVDPPLSDTVEVSEGEGVSLEQDVEAFVGEEMDVGFAAETQGRGERMDSAELAVEGNSVGGPIHLHFLTGLGFEAAPDLLG